MSTIFSLISSETYAIPDTLTLKKEHSLFIVRDCRLLRFLEFDDNAEDVHD